MRSCKAVFGVLFLSVLCLSVSGASAVAEEKPLMMATTTSTDNTGLLDYLAPLFQQDAGIELKWTSTGTGKALELGKSCDVDVLLVHAPAAEKKYVEEGFGKNRTEIMYNDFIVVGPESDPAGVKGKTVAEALSAIKEKQATFASRGDDSGTHKMEISLWKSAGLEVPDKESWYVQTGQGMLATINVAAERGGYTMTDRGTYIKYEDTMKGNPPLKILVENDQLLLNQYSVIAVNPEKCPDVQFEKAMKFSEWMAGEKGQKAIGDFKVLGKPLFKANAK
jgi:tungstate transport system substrate-binding protein